ncbi:MAG: PhnD/SsuA/transferrin family substrate-binding protein [Kiloniellales bacterium]
MKLAAAATVVPGSAAAASPFRLGLTPVFLDNDALVIDRLRSALSTALDTSIELVQRRTYQEVTGLLLEGSVDAAWLCGYPFLQHRSVLSLIGVPVWRGSPRYQSYLIAAADDDAAGLADLAGGTHAFADPDSNSGWLVTASDLARMNQRPESFFSRSVFTYGHRNVVRAVASGLTRSGSVDGYVWEVLSAVEPDLTERTRIVTRSEWFGFPPFVARTAELGDPRVAGFTEVLLNLSRTAEGRGALRLLHLDDIAIGDAALFEGIAARMRVLGSDR